MAELVDHLAELTGARDRELLDVTLVGALRDLLRPRPRAVAIYRSVGEPGHERWLTRARLAAGELAASADPAWIDLEQLPRREAHPERLQACSSRCIVVVPGPPHRTFFPVATDRDDYSERDTLTGLLNRKTFDESFMKTVAEAEPAAAADTDAGRRVGGRCRHWLGVIDIDHFKRVNDSFGHLIGDEVLLLMSRLMRSSFRFDDRLYRFGGEEFVVLMRCADGDAAAHAFERLRGDVELF